MGNGRFMGGMWESFSLKRAVAKKILEDAAREGQEGIQGQWQQESAYRDVLEQVRGNVDMGCGAHMMRKSCVAIRGWQLGKSSEKDAEKKGKSSEWTW